MKEKREAAEQLDDTTDESPSSDASEPAELSLYELWGRDRSGNPLRDTPRVIATALRLAWGAGAAGLVAALATQLLSGVAVAVQVTLVTLAVGALRSSGGFGRAVWLLLAIGVVTAFINLGGALIFTQQRMLSERLLNYSERRLIAVAARVDLAAFDETDFFTMLQRARIGLQFPFQIAMATLTLANLAAGVLSLAVVLLRLQPLLLAVVIASAAMLWISSLLGSRAAYQRRRQLMPLYRRRELVVEWLTSREAAKEVRSFGIADFFVGLHRDAGDELLARLAAIFRGRGVIIGLSSLGGSILTFLAIGYLIWQGSQGRITLAAASGAFLALYLVQPRLEGLVNSLAGLYDSALYLQDFDSFVHLETEVAAGRPEGTVPGGFSSLRAEGVGFAYAGHPTAALRGVDFAVKPGEVVALVGENGSGKTTLAKLLSGLYAPAQGRILWDGVDVSTIDPGLLRRRIAVVFQDFQKYVVSARSNIGLGDVERIENLEAIREAARNSGIDEALSGLPDGYETLLGPQFEGGKDLSVGQWQRLALARAFFRDADVVILDEPTAALDPKAEHDLFERMRDLFAGRAVVLISHRFSSVRSADRIYVLHHGEVVEHGSHDQLMAQAGRYAELFTLQANAYLGPQAVAEEDLTATGAGR
jgi:ATP-binding cassette subfamily B protein